MPTFKDRNGRPWTVDITVGGIKRVRDLLKIDLYGLVDDKFAGYQKLLADPVSLVDVVFVLCEADAKAAGISDVQFGSALSGQTLSDMQDAFTEALIDFFPDRSQAAVLQKMIQKTKLTAAEINRQNSAAIDGVNVASLVESLKKASGNLPESSGLIPALEASAN